MLTIFLFFFFSWTIEHIFIIIFMHKIFLKFQLSPHLTQILNNRTQATRIHLILLSMAFLVPCCVKFLYRYDKRKQNMLSDGLTLVKSLNRMFTTNSKTLPLMLVSFTSTQTINPICSLKAHGGQRSHGYTHYDFPNITHLSHLVMGNDG